MNDDQIVRTPTLDTAVRFAGPDDAAPVLLLHGWPDSARGWTAVAAQLVADGYRVVLPDLRGHGGTRFRDPARLRDGRGVALAADALELLDALGVGACAVVGHDWGADVAYHLAALAPERFSSITALASGYRPHGAFAVPAFPQARAFWYQWLMASADGAAAVRDDPIGFARIQWDTWSPAGWFDELEFARTAEAFGNPDWVDVTLSAYRSRLVAGEPIDPAYAAAQARIESTGVLQVPALLVQGGDDRCELPGSSQGLDRWFGAGYRRVVLDRVGHFPHREAPDVVADLVATHLRRTAS